MLAIGLAGAACSSFSESKPDGSDAGAAADGAAPNADGGTPGAEDGGARPDPDACPLDYAFDSSLEVPWDGWTVDHAGGALSGDLSTFVSPPASLALDLPPATVDRMFLVKELPYCHVVAKTKIYVAGAFGDGEIDFFTVSDAVIVEAIVGVIHASAHPGQLTAESPGGAQETLGGVVNEWRELEIDVNPFSRTWSVASPTVRRTGTLAASFGKERRFFLQVGAPWVDSSRTKTWKVRFDDVSVRVLPP